MEIVRIVCPKCHVELDVKNKLNVEQKLIKCPNCGCQLMVRFQGQSQQQYQQPQYQQPQYQQPQYQQPQYQQPQYRRPVQDDGHTIYGGHPQYQPAPAPPAQPVQPMGPQPVAAMGGYNSESTVPASSVNNRPANVAGFLVYNNVRYPLSIGRNTIGRKSSTPQATVQIDTGGNNTMSRLHAVIETVRMGDMSIRAIISNGSNKNPTFVSGVLLNGADKLILKNGAEIKMGNIILRYEISV